MILRVIALRVRSHKHVDVALAETEDCVSMASLGGPSHLRPSSMTIGCIDRDMEIAIDCLIVCLLIQEELEEDRHVEKQSSQTPSNPREVDQDVPPIES